MWDAILGTAVTAGGKSEVWSPSGTQTFLRALELERVRCIVLDAFSKELELDVGRVAGVACFVVIVIPHCSRPRCG